MIEKGYWICFNSIFFQFTNFSFTYLRLDQPSSFLKLFFPVLCHQIQRSNLFKQRIFQNLFVFGISFAESIFRRKEEHPSTSPINSPHSIYGPTSLHALMRPLEADTRTCHQNFFSLKCWHWQLAITLNQNLVLFCGNIQCEVDFCYGSFAVGQINI